MQESVAQPAMPTDRRDRRVYVWWGVSLGLLGLLAAFCVLFLAPYMQVRRIVSGIKRDIDEQDARAMITRLGGPDETVRKLTFYMRLPGAIAPELDRNMAAGLLGCCGRPAVPALIAALDYYPGPNDWGGLAERCQAIRALGRIGTDASEAIPHLLKRGNKESSAVVQALGDIGVANQEVLDYLMDCIDDRYPDDEELRCRNIAVAKALGKLGPSAEVAVPELMKLLQGVQPLTVRVAAADAMGSIGPGAAQAVSGLCAEACDPGNDPQLRVAVAWALVKIGLPCPNEGDQANCLEMLGSAANDKNAEVAAAAAEALKKIRSEEPPK